MNSSNVNRLHYKFGVKSFFSSHNLLAITSLIFAPFPSHFSLLWHFVIGSISRTSVLPFLWPVLLSIVKSNVVGIVSPLKIQMLCKIMHAKVAAFISLEELSQF